LFFSLKPHSAVLGDNNRELINVYRVLRDEPEEIHQRLVHIPREKDAYYRWRSKNPRSLDKQTRALRFIYLNHNCFNGIYRTNAAGQFNVPFGSKLSRYLTREEFIECSKTLKNTRLIAGDFEKSIAEVDKGDFVYLDPPYALTTRRVFREYGGKPFDVDDVERLSNALVAIDQRGAKFVVSYADCPQARKLATAWRATKFSVRRHIAGFSDHRTYAYEWILTNIDH
jgi:DNA adenine methylase